MPFSNDRVPKWQRERGIEQWTWPEYLVDRAAPIPLAEAIREVWDSQGMPEAEQTKYLKALSVFFVTGGTGARVKEDIHK